MAPQVRDPASSLQQCGFDPWPGVQQKKKKVVIKKQGMKKNFFKSEWPQGH